MINHGQHSTTRAKELHPDRSGAGGGDEATTANFQDIQVSDTFDNDFNGGNVLE